MQSHIRKVYVCLAVTCHLRFWQNDQGLLCATAVTQGWNGYRNKSQHRKLTLEKKMFPPLQQGFKLATFRSQVQCSNHWAIPAPTGVFTATPWLTLSIDTQCWVFCWTRQQTFFILNVYKGLLWPVFKVKGEFLAIKVKGFFFFFNRGSLSVCILVIFVVQMIFEKPWSNLCKIWNSDVHCPKLSSDIVRWLICKTIHKVVP